MRPPYRRRVHSLNGPVTSKRRDSTSARLGTRPGFEEWAADVSPFSRRRRAVDAAAPAGEGGRRASRIGRALRFVAKTVHLV